MRKILLILLGVILIAIIGIFIYGSVYLQRSLPVKEGEVILPGIRDRVEITFDAMGIPQIWATNEEDGYFALGYMHAADRLFQMDLTRRVASGRLAEFFGKSVLDFDRLQRKIGHHLRAEKHLDLLSERSGKRITAYTAGVNAYADRCRVLPFEYALLRKSFEKWTAYDVLCILSFQTWFSDFLQNPDQIYLGMAEEVGLGEALSLLQGYPDWAPNTVPQKGKPVGDEKTFKQEVAKALLGSGRFPFLMSTASNSWVISPGRSASGHAMLASDPHLEIARLPQFWYAAGLHVASEGPEVLGITTPGLPYFVMGHNGKTSWAFTVGGIDVTEYYLEQVHPEDSLLFKTPEGWEPFENRTEIIKVDGAEHDTLRIRYTKNGPVLVENDSLNTIYSFHWAGFDMALEQTADAGFRLSETINFEEFRRTVTKFGALDANWTYADHRGNIGYQLGTPLAIRPDSLGIMPAPGWKDGFSWLGYRSLEETPYAFNPDQGWLATCNNKQDVRHIDYELQGYFSADRITRITELLKSKKRFTMDDMYSYQMDLKDVYLMRWRDKLIPVLQELGYDDEAENLAGWDGRTAIDSWETAFLKVFLYHFKHLTLDDEFGELTKRMNLLWIEKVFDSDSMVWYDDKRTEGRVETRKDILIQAIDTVLIVTGNREWGDFNSLTMNHPLSVVPIIGDILNLSHGPWEWTGTKGSLNASFLEEREDGTFKTIVGPSWRFVIDFSNIDAATMVLPSGNSGNPKSPHFMDFLELWKTGKRWNVPFTYEKVSAKAVSRLQFYPNNGE